MTNEQMTKGNVIARRAKPDEAISVIIGQDCFGLLRKSRNDAVNYGLWSACPNSVAERVVRSLGLIQHREDDIHLLTRRIAGDHFEDIRTFLQRNGHTEAALSVRDRDCVIHTDDCAG